MSKATCAVFDVALELTWAEEGRPVSVRESFVDLQVTDLQHYEMITSLIITRQSDGSVGHYAKL
ncbi:hypothetical protein OHT68_43695 [Streptomyces canus]|uniref:hypothetical protein n=1 Tax=Streptomyces canus TaxID=58343 RepID=UPI002E2BE4E9|nr:hypothetical protein [Streptomyces canus]